MWSREIGGLRRSARSTDTFLLLANACHGVMSATRFCTLFARSLKPAVRRGPSRRTKSAYLDDKRAVPPGFVMYGVKFALLLCAEASKRAYQGVGANLAAADSSCLSQEAKHCWESGLFCNMLRGNVSAHVVLLLFCCVQTSKGFVAFARSGRVSPLSRWDGQTVPDTSSLPVRVPVPC